MLNLKNIHLPISFVEWYWTNYASGDESPSYVRANESSEYGVSLYEYFNSNPFLVVKELREWFSDKLEVNGFKKWIRKWIDDKMEEYKKSFNDYHLLLTSLDISGQ